MIPTTSPICIIGAGPAGAVASLFLTKLKIKHLVLEKETFPRDKICGDGLDLNTLRVLHHYDPSSIAEFIGKTDTCVPLTALRLYAPNGGFSDMYAHSGNVNRPLYVVAKRKDFDNWLFEKLPSEYATIITQAEVTDLVRENDKITIHFSHQNMAHQVVTPLVFGADGDHSTVQRKLDVRKIDRRYYAAALRQYYQNITPIAGEPRLEVYFPKKLPFGYFWIFPLPNGTSNVGLGMQSAELSATKTNLREALQDIIQNDPVIAPRFAQATPLETAKGWGLPLASRLRKAYGDNYLLLGDAASLIHPLSGEGIGSAMISGYIAAHLAEKAIAATRYDDAFLMPYQKEIGRRLVSETNFYRRIINLRPDIWQRFFLNTLINSGLGKRLFERSAAKWLETAFTKKIVLEF